MGDALAESALPGLVSANRLAACYAEAKARGETSLMAHLANRAYLDTPMLTVAAKNLGIAKKELSRVLLLGSENGLFPYPVKCGRRRRPSAESCPDTASERLRLSRERRRVRVTDEMLLRIGAAYAETGVAAEAALALDIPYETVRRVLKRHESFAREMAGETLDRAEVERVLELANGDGVKAAALAGMSPARFRHAMERTKVNPWRFVGGGRREQLLATWRVVRSLYRDDGQTFAVLRTSREGCEFLAELREAEKLRKDVAAGKGEKGNG
jgi:hypothetical protein